MPSSEPFKGEESVFSRNIDRIQFSVVFDFDRCLDLLQKSAVYRQKSNQPNRNAEHDDMVAQHIERQRNIERALRDRNRVILPCQCPRNSVSVENVAEDDNAEHEEHQNEHRDVYLLAARERVQKTDEGKQVLVPKVPAFVLDIDLGSNRVTMRLIEGMM